MAEQSFVFLSTGIRALRESGEGGTLIQVTGGSARRAMPGRGLWSAGAQAARAMTHAAAQEVREEGIHVALLIVDATIESPKTADFTRDAPKNALADMRLIAEAVEYLASQQPRAYTHELMLTPAGDRWVPYGGQAAGSGTRLRARAAFWRSTGSSTSLRRRITSGVTSTHSSSRMNSSAWSSESLWWGTSFTVSSEPDARMFVCFFSRTAFTSRSSARAFSPTTIPS